MRLTSLTRSIYRSHEDALKDTKTIIALMRRYGMARSDRQPLDAQPFSVSTSQGPEHLHQLSKSLSISIGHPRPLIHPRRSFLQKALNTFIDPKWMLHRSLFLGSRKSMASKQQIVEGSRNVLGQILSAIKKRNLSSLSPLLLDDKILPDLSKSLSTLTPRQMSCLDVVEDDFVGVDGVVDRWKRLDLDEDDPCSLIHSLRIGSAEKEDLPILSYSVDMMAILRKNVLVSNMGTLPAPTDSRFMPAPRAYKLPYFRIMYATVDFAHKSTDTTGEFSQEPFLLDFHVHSF